jgi:hypothetical protein
MEWQHLRGIPSVWAVAGGRLKLEVLWTLLICRHLEKDKSKSVIKELSTDLKSAEELHKARLDFESLPDDLRSWYQAIVANIFRDDSQG